MKIEIVSSKRVGWTTIVDIKYIPNRLERLMGIKERVKSFIDIGRTHWIDSLIVWFDYPSMTRYGRFEKLDDYLRKEKYVNNFLN